MTCTHAPCGKELIVDMEIEYSHQVSGYFCSPECAESFYFEYMGSVVVEREERVRLLKEEPKED